MRSVVAASLAVGMAVLSVGHAANAFELSLEASPCGSPAALLRKVQARLTRSHPEAWRFTVRVDRDGDRYTATVDMTDPAGQPSRRVIAGTQCHSVFDAAALVTALTLESGFSALPVDADLPVSAREERTESAPPWRPALGLTGSGGAPAPLGDPVGWQASVGLAFWQAGTTPSMASLEYLRGQGSVRDGSWKASLVLDAVALRVAPLLVELGSGLGLASALGLELGRLRGSGRFEGGRESQGFWGAAVAELGLEYRYRYVQLGIAPTARVVFKRHEFEAGGESLYQIPRADVGGRLRVTVWID